MKQFAVLSSDPNLMQVFEFIQHYDLAHEVHLNRTRFWVPEGPVLTQCLLRFDTIWQIQDQDLLS
jgi:hypothetical protein